MGFHLHIDLGQVSDTFQTLQRILELGDSLVAHLDALEAAVSANTTVIQSAITLITDIATKLEEAKNDPVAIQQLVDDLNASKDSLAAAVAANTPAE